MKAGQIKTAIPNLVTLVRVLMTPVILLELAHGHYLAGGWLFGGAAFTDIVDGALARRFGMGSKTGQYFDPIADKILLTAIYIGLALGHAVPVWIVAIILGRDLWILLLSSSALAFTDFRELKPSVWGKASTFAQVMAAVAVMGGYAYDSPVFALLGKILLGAVVVLAALSGGDYTLRGIRWLAGSRRRSLTCERGGSSL
jgi:cardiolipin synthase